MYTLVFVVLFSGAPVSSNTVQGYSTLEACDKSAMELRKSFSIGTNINMKYKCTKVE